MELIGKVTKMEIGQGGPERATIQNSEGPGFFLSIYSFDGLKIGQKVRIIIQEEPMGTKEECDEQH